MFLCATCLTHASASELQIVECYCSVILEIVLEVHYIGSKDIPAVLTIPEDNSQLHGFHIDNIKSFGVLDKYIREFIVAVIGKRQ